MYNICNYDVTHMLSNANHFLFTLKHRSYTNNAYFFFCDLKCVQVLVDTNP
uniref:Uncharacterized protein n=1 Tax=Anguilla anguilla TaxID=7936 RepID=A0A0E9WM75_ANGAN